MSDSPLSLRDAVFVDGCRTPFLRSGTAYADLKAYDLGRTVLKRLLTRTGMDPERADRVIMGCVVQDVDTTNVARECALAAGFPARVPAFTVTMACISSNQAISSGVDLIRSGQADVVVAGGTETLSDLPIRLSKNLRSRLIKARKYKSPADYLNLLKGLSPKDLLPDVPSISEYSTGETMGESADKLAAMFGVSREAQDEYALRSHHRAAGAWSNGSIGDEVVPVSVPPDFEPIERDNGFRADTSMEKLRGLSPAFVKPYGTVTAGNASFLTDGASAVLLMSREAAEADGFVPRAVLRDYVFVAQDPREELLLGPAYAIPRLLDLADLDLTDVDVFELHEAFAGQVLAVLRALAADDFAREHLGRDRAPGEIPMERLNVHGGSLSLGHPFGATGARLVTTAVNRLHAEDGRYAVVAACAAGGLGHAMLIERVDLS
ncbi:MAG: acetyl-CoA C-acyltransferase [Rhodothermales bacterium]